MSLVRRSRARTSHLWIAAAVAALTLTACSDSGTDPAPTETTATTTATPTPTSDSPTTEQPDPLPAVDELLVSPGRVGPVLAGMTKDEALATGLFDADVEVGGEECGREEPLGWRTEYASTLDVLTTEDGTVVSLGVRGEQPRTSDGLGVGSTLRQVSKVYETAEMTEAGYGQTGVFVTDGEKWLGFLFDADIDTITRKEKVLLVEVTQGTRPDLMRDGC